MQTILVSLSLSSALPVAMNMLDVPFTAMTDSKPVHAASVEAGGAISLSDLATGAFATIHAVLPSDRDADRDLVMRLVEIGFVPGERVRVVAVGHPGRQPIAVRLSAADSGRKNLNGATFALRRHEADLIRVVPDFTVDPSKRT